MSRLLPRWTAAAAVLLAAAAACPAQTGIPADLRGPALAQEVRARYSPSVNLSYRDAREALFGRVEVFGGRVRLIYTNERITTPGIPSAVVANTEHVWPQSRFDNAPARGRIKADLHHLFPCRPLVNSRRGNNAFAEIDDAQTEGWWASNHPVAAPPAATRDGYSESTNTRFEPREDHKGDVARALFYVYAVYGDQPIDRAWFDGQRDTLLRWHRQDPPSAEELARNARVQGEQGNANPFILEPGLIDRLLDVPPAGGGSQPGPILLVSSTQPANGNGVGKLKVVTFNAREIFSVNRVTQRQADFQALAAEFKPDVLMLQEVTSYQQAVKIREVMGLTGYFVACSNFNPNNNAQHNSFEVAVLSRFPLDEVVEYDPTPDNDPNDEEQPDEEPLAAPNVPGLTSANVQRGYLKVRIEELKLVVRVTHLKSSNGDSGIHDDLNNAKKRERVAAAIADAVADDAADNPGYTSLVAGDFNVGERDAGKLGKDLLRGETEAAAGEDGYDETHALMTEGLVRGLKMKSLTKDLPPTYNGNFGDTGPIDCVYVHGPAVARFSLGERSPQRYGSDHWAVRVLFERD